MNSLVQKIRRSLERDGDLPMAERARKGLAFALGTLLAPRYLREATQLGPRARTVGKPCVVNDGTMRLGADLLVTSTFSPVELVAQAGAHLVIGDSVLLNYGTSIRAASRVTLGSRILVGPQCIIDDTDLTAEGGVFASPITIGSGVWLAGRVTVLPGTTIGDGTVITAGSIVSGDIPAGVIAGGVPARIIRVLDDTDRAPSVVSSIAAEKRSSVVTPDAISSGALTALRGVVLSDFTVGDLAVRLADTVDEPAMHVVDAPFCQTTQGLLSGPPSPEAKDFVLVWTRPELALPSFDRLVRGAGATDEELLADVDAFAELVTRGASHYRMTFVPTWWQPAHQRGLGMIDARPGGITWALTMANARLMTQLASVPNVFVLNTQRWAEASASHGRSMAKAWYLGKIPFPAELFAEVARDLKAAARGIEGRARKLLVLDLDHTLWGGVVGDVGWEHLQLGGHDGAGEAFVDFQHAVRALRSRGIMLGIVSKNTEAVALEAIKSHPQMVLRIDDFVGWRINWHDKAQNVADLAMELNIGLQSVVFVDDNPVERARVRAALPEVFVPDWPEDSLRYTERLHALRCFDMPAISQEDADRTALYAAERARDSERTSVGSLDEWLLSLGMRVTVEHVGSGNITRTAQLLNKTNQMNLATRRLSEAELIEWSRPDTRVVLALTVEDRFGSAGLTGILGLEATDQCCEVTDFVLSCRVMGRRVEYAMLHLAASWARARGMQTVVARYRRTTKNQPCHDLLLSSALDRDAAGETFIWNCTDPFPLPDAIQLTWVSSPQTDTAR